MFYVGNWFLLKRIYLILASLSSVDIINKYNYTGEYNDSCALIGQEIRQVIT